MRLEASAFLALYSFDCPNTSSIWPVRIMAGPTLPEQRCARPQHYWLPVLMPSSDGLRMSSTSCLFSDMLPASNYMLLFLSAILASAWVIAAHRAAC